jgi:diaminohydroxyphosphoribosylaminopyrimidine deaminase/5-amino-6-(5-phosphoribosylamino)uracil reductase
MVGTNTVILDDPRLTVRCVEGRNPLRITLDRKAGLDSNRKIFDAQAETIVFVPPGQSKLYGKKTESIELPFDEYLEEAMLQTLYERKIQSVIIEGGARLTESFVGKNLWDEARVFKSRVSLFDGVKAPRIGIRCESEESLDDDKLIIYKNPGNEKRTIR